jgi:NADH/NAD ratio-sensing transcriptional regulator Rex
MKAERVIVVGVNGLGEAFATCAMYTTDKQLEKHIKRWHDCDDFIVFYDENIDELDEVVQEHYANAD